MLLCYLNVFFFTFWMLFWIVFTISGAFFLYDYAFNFVLYLSMSLQLQVALCCQMALQVHDQRAEGHPAHTA